MCRRSLRVAVRSGNVEYSRMNIIQLVFWQKKIQIVYLEITCHWHSMTVDHISTWPSIDSTDDHKRWVTKNEKETNEVNFNMMRSSLVKSKYLAENWPRFFWNTLCNVRITYYWGGGGSGWGSLNTFCHGNATINSLCVVDVHIPVATEKHWKRCQWSTTTSSSYCCAKYDAASSTKHT
jgi:hypothetical protein